jgi:RIB43A
LQEQALAKEAARIKARRERDEIRRERFLNARTRIMGIDAEALDKQVAEMRQAREDGKDADRVESK